MPHLEDRAIQVIREKAQLRFDARVHVYEDDYVVDTKKYKSLDQNAATTGAAFGSTSN
jgi:hypothetical protein